jgi:hypothetical protein
MMYVNTLTLIIQIRNRVQLSLTSMVAASKSSSRGGRGASPLVSSAYSASAASMPLFIAVWDP